MSDEVERLTEENARLRAKLANRESVQAQYVAKHGLPQPDLWKRTTCEMALIRQSGRESELVTRKYDEIHALAEQILDERISRDTANCED